MSTAENVIGLPTREGFIKKCVQIMTDISKKTGSAVKRAVCWIGRELRHVVNWLPMDAIVKPFKWVWVKATPVRGYVFKVVRHPLAPAIVMAAGLALAPKIVLLLIGLGAVCAMWVIVNIIFMLVRFADRAVAEATKEKPVVVKPTTDEEFAAAAQRVSEEAEEVIKKAAAEKQDTTKSNGKVSYTSRVPTDLKLDPNETFEDRYRQLTKLLKLAEDPSHEVDTRYVSDLMSRQNLLMVRDGRGGKVGKNASVGDIHRNFRAEYEKTAQGSPDAEVISARIDWGVAYQMARAEDTRLKAIRKLKAEHDKLVGV